MQATRASPDRRARCLQVKLFADGADLAGIAKLAADPHIAGFTTNPTLMRKAGITDYEAFGRRALEIIGGRPISFEVFADDSARDAAPGAQDRVLGRERLREDSGDRHERGRRRRASCAS